MKATNQIPWGVMKRLEFIEFRVFWFGGVNRRDIIGKFGVSILQASNDLTRYQRAAEDNIKYCRHKKQYIATPNFMPVFYHPHAEDYMEYLKETSVEEETSETNRLSCAPHIDSVPVLHRGLDPGILRSIVRAVHNSRAVEIYYQFLTPFNPEPVWQWISPHAFFHDGFRWYVRAFSHNDREFMNYGVSQIFEVRNDDAAAVDGEEDRFWRESFEVVLIPNPVLSPSQRSAIAHQCGRSEMRMRITIRKACLQYIKKWLRLDVAEALDQPQESPIIVENRDEFEAALEETSTSCSHA